MCTAISYRANDHYFGRNLDLECSYNEQVVITPRNFVFEFRKLPAIHSHYAMIGIATVAEDYPLYYEATNECGLSIAGLSFPGNAVYFTEFDNKDNVTPFELVPWLLAQCCCLQDVKKKLENLNICDILFCAEFPVTPLHWMISDNENSLVLEQTETGLHWYDNPLGVLTNNPPFPYHQYNLQNYIQLHAKDPENYWKLYEKETPYSRGLGAIGLPGDYSSASRFIKAGFVLLNSKCEPNEESSVNQFFHILDAVSMPRGCVEVNGKQEITVYSCCCNTSNGVYYYKTYNNSQICYVDMHHEDLDARELIIYPLNSASSFICVN